MKSTVIVSSRPTNDEDVDDRPIANAADLMPKKRQGAYRRPWKTSIQSLTWNPKILKASCYIIVVLVPLTLATWLPLTLRELLHADTFEGSPIGGSLSLTQAKAIDFVSGAVIAPLLLALFNYIWFANARVSIVNEKMPRNQGVSLYTLVEASSTSSGSYNLFKIWTLCSGMSNRLVMLAMLTLIAALAQSSLSNVIAYEAFMQPINMQPVQLRLLKGAFVGGATSVSAPNGTITAPTIRQRLTWAQLDSALVPKLKWQNSTQVLNKGAYIAPNTTREYLDKLDGPITTLHNIPVLQATINCTSHPVESFTWTHFRDHAKVFLDVPSHSNSDKSSPGWTGNVDSSFEYLYDNPGGVYAKGTIVLPIVARSYDNTSLFVGVIASYFPDGGNPRQWLYSLLQPVTTPFGEVHAKALNLTELQGNNSKPCAAHNDCMAVSFGLVCTFSHKSGVADLERSTVGEPWIPEHATWNSETNLINVSQFADSTSLRLAFTTAVTCANDPDLAQYPECTGVRVTPTDRSEPFLGLNPKDYNYETLAHNILYLAMETQRIGFEAGAKDTSSDSSDLFVSITTAGKAQRYRMTYVPALLIAGLVSLFLAAALSTSLMILSARSQSLSSRQFRMVDSLRLLVDSVAGLRHEGFQYEAKAWTNEELETWATQLMVRYDVSQDTSQKAEPPVLVLSRVATSLDDD